jgi:hypothetical protein
MAGLHVSGRYPYDLRSEVQAFGAMHRTDFDGVVGLAV